MKKIIVIEDDPDLLSLIREVLADEGFDVMSYPDKNSVKRIILNRPDLVLMDNRLTDGLGSSLCREIKSNEMTRNIPVLMMSGDKDLSAIATESGADAYLAKPFDLLDLIDMVKKWSGMFDDVPDPDTFDPN